MSSAIRAGLITILLNELNVRRLNGYITTMKKIVILQDSTY